MSDFASDFASGMSSTYSRRKDKSGKEKPGLLEKMEKLRASNEETSSADAPQIPDEAATKTTTEFKRGGMVGRDYCK